MAVQVSRVVVRLFLAAALLPLTVSSLQAQGLPSPWLNADVGNPTWRGRAAESAGTFTVEGNGTDIAGTVDQFHFAYQRITGDVDLRALVTDVEYIDAWTKGGVMIRESLTQNSKHAFMSVSAGRGFAFARRVKSGGTQSTSGGSGTAPAWVRLVRTGNQFRGYLSFDGSTWTLVGTDTIAMSASVYVGMVATSHHTGQLATVSFTNVSVTTPGTTPPAEWTGADVGAPGVAGRASESGGMFSVTGAGADLWDPNDEFYYYYKQASGDVQIVARLVSLQRQHDWTKGGVMIRSAMTGTSAHVSMLGTSGNGWAFQRRGAAGELSLHSPGSPGVAPGWVKITRIGHDFSGYESSDGVNWTLVGTETVSMPSSVYVGLAVSSHNTSLTSTATFDNVTISTPSANQAPAVSITSPASGASYTAPASITINATASDSDGTVSRVDFYQGSTLIGSDTSSPYSLTWNNAAAGTYSLTARATDNTGAVTTSSAVSVTVSTANQAPVVSISSPANGASYTAPASITINAAASDSDGAVSRVDFYRGSTLIGSDTSSPYSVAWTNVAAGTYSLTARATDNTGAVTTSSAVSVTVSTAANQLPTAAITSPSNGASYIAPASITINATASDSDGTVSRVDFYQGSTLIGSDTSSPYSFTWSNVATGSYSLTVRATDNAGGVRTSTAVSVTVTSPANQAPTVSITTPVTGATFTAPGTVAIAADAADGDGTVSRVDFYQGSTLIGSDSTLPFTFPWSNVAAGTYTLTARAVDNTGATTTSAAVTVTVNSANPTRVVFSPSSDHDDNVTSYSVAVYRSTDPVTATPVATRDLGKPAPVAGEIDVNISTLVDPLPGGAYYAIVTAIGPGGSTGSTPSTNFTK